MGRRSFPVQPTECVQLGQPRRDEAQRDPALDEELEIPAFLRRQMNPR